MKFNTNSAQGFVKKSIWIVAMLIVSIIGFGTVEFIGNVSGNPILLSFERFQDVAEEIGPLTLTTALHTIGLFIVGPIVAGFFSGLVYILPEWERLVVLRLGKYSGLKGPGIFIMPPFIYSIAASLDMRIRSIDIPVTQTLTEDNIPVSVQAVVELKVSDPKIAILEVVNYQKTVISVATEALKNLIGSLSLKDLLGSRDEVASRLQALIDKEVEAYGVDIPAVRITDINTPKELVEELAVIARAERASTAKQIQADAEVDVATKLSEAARILLESDGAMKLRELQTLAEMAKEEGTMIIVHPTGDSTSQLIASSAAGTQTSS